MNTLTGLIKLPHLILTPGMMITKESFTLCLQLILPKIGLKKLKLLGHG